jgi:DNA-binding FadR family transcriptional regulator
VTRKTQPSTKTPAARPTPARIEPSPLQDRNLSTKSDRVRLPKASEIVARSLRNRIIRGELSEGTMLPSEADLAIQFGVSRPTLREAIRILESEQLLQLSRGLHGGARVLKPHLDVAARYFGFLLQTKGVALPEVFRTRVMIEPSAVRILAREMNPETVARLRAVLAEADDATAPVENALAFSRFHHALVEETGNQALALLMGMLTTVLDRYLVAVASVFGAYTDSDAETRRAKRSRSKLIDLIEEGEEDKAADLWRRYLQEAEVKLQSWQPAEFVVDLLQGD